MRTTHDLKVRLDYYLHANEDFKKVYRHVRERFEAASNLTAHNWAHIYRDTINAIMIGEAEQANMSVVLPAIVMHDIGFLYDASGKTHAAIGAEKLEEFLAEANVSFSKQVVGEMRECIRTHKGSMHNEKPVSLEAKVVADADLLEKFGPFGVYQYIRTFTEFNYSLETILNRQEQMATLTLETTTGKALAEGGRQFVIDFFAELRKAQELYEQ